MVYKPICTMKVVSKDTTVRYGSSKISYRYAGRRAKMGPSIWVFADAHESGATKPDVVCANKML